MYSLFCLEDFSWGSSVIVLPPKPQFEIPNRPEWKILYAIITHVHTFFFFVQRFCLRDFSFCSPVFDLPPKPLFEILRRPRCMHLVKRCVFGSLVVTAGKVCQIKRWQLGAEFVMLHTHNNCLIANSFI